MRVTIFADAAFDHRTKAGSWAGWAKSGRGYTKHAAVIKVEFIDSLQAEMAAIVNAVHIARKSGVAVMGDDLLIQTDCVAAIHMLRRQFSEMKKRHQAKYGDVRKAFDEKTAGYKIEFRHVKGHSKVQDARSHINRECDRAARKLTRGERKKRIAAEEGTTA